MKTGNWKLGNRPLALGQDISNSIFQFQFSNLKFLIASFYFPSSNFRFPWESARNLKYKRPWPAGPAPRASKLILPPPSIPCNLYTRYDQAGTTQLCMG